MVGLISHFPYKVTHANNIYIILHQCKLHHGLILKKTKKKLFMKLYLTTLACRWDSLQAPVAHFQERF